MKTPDEWAIEIIAFMQKNPVTTLAGATDQIKGVVKRIQDDAIPPAPTLQ